MFYAQSTITVISRPDTFCHHTLNVKNVYMLKPVERERERERETERQRQRETETETETDRQTDR